MKRLILALSVILFLVQGIKAQAPNQFKYQAVLRNADGSVLSDEDVTVNISILKGNESGTRVFEEQYNIKTTPQGLINLDIGSLPDSDLNTIDWGADTYFIKIVVNDIEMGTSQLLSVPYALYAEQTGTWTKDSSFIYYDKGSVGIGTSTPKGDLHIFDENDNTWLTVETGKSNKWAISELRAPGSVLQFSLVGNEAPGGGIIKTSTANIDAIAPGGLNIINEDSSHIAFVTKGYATTDEKMRITANGDVGIGTTTPGERLEINGAIKVDSGGYTGITDGATTPVPSGGAGTIIFLDTHFFGWNGSSWKQLD